MTPPPKFTPPSSAHINTSRPVVVGLSELGSRRRCGSLWQRISGSFELSVGEWVLVGGCG